MNNSSFALIISFVFALIFSVSAEGGSFQKGDKLPPQGRDLYLVTYVSDNLQVRHAGTLIRSLRENGGEYCNSEVFVIFTSPILDLTHLRCFPGIHLLLSDMKQEYADFPLAIKAFAAAQAERILQNSSATLAWFDPETIIINPPYGLIPQGDDKVIAQPVFCTNNISMSPGEPINDYWGPIYDYLDVNCSKIPVIESLIDRKQMLAYYNCEIISVRASEKIFEDWAEVMDKLLSDSDYAVGVCNTPLRKLFLHQAVLSAVLVKKAGRSMTGSLSLKYGYPLHAWKEIPVEKRIVSLNELSCAILEDLWTANPSWIDDISANESLKRKLEDAYLRFSEIAPGLYRQEGSCNSYLVVTGDSSVLIDPAGAVTFPMWFEIIIKRYPLSMILLTHGHNDHRDNLNYWKREREIPVIGQKELMELVAYQDMLGGFFARRNSIWAGNQVPDSWIPALTDPGVTRYFNDSLIIKKENRTFVLIHTSGETPDHTLILIPEIRAAFVGDNYYSSFPNLYTFRGTKPRWALDYFSALDAALRANPAILLPGHGLWLEGEEQINHDAGGYRDAIKYVHDETVKGMNEGKDRFTLMREVELPAEYSFINQSYGKVAWSVRGIYEGYAGWFDGDPLSMYPFRASEINNEIIELAGTGPLLVLTSKYLKDGDYTKSLFLADMLLSVYPEMEEAMDLKRESLLQLKAISDNYIEMIWLNYALSSCSP